MAVTVTGAGAGANGTGAIAPGYPSVTAGDLLLLHAVVASATATVTGAPSGFTLLSGPDNNTGDTLRQWLYGKIASGSESGTESITISGTNVRLGRIYGFTGQVTSSVAAAVEDITSGGQASGTITMPQVDTTGPNELAVALIAADGTADPGDATGETGGDWTEAVASYQMPATAWVQLQTAAMPSAGTISGGSFAGGNSVFIRYGLAVIAAAVSTQAVRPDADTTTTGWTSTPLFSKINESSPDGTVITATAA